MIEPPNLPLFEVGDLSNDLEEKLKTDEKVRRDNKIKHLKNIEESDKEKEDAENQDEIQKMILEYQDINESQDNLSDTEL